MAESFRLHVVTPEGEIIDRQVVEVTAPGVQGEFGVLPHHARYMTVLGVGELRFKGADGSEDVLAVAGGFAEVTRTGVNVLAQTAEDAQEIDVAREEAAAEAARRRLEKPEDEAERERASLELERSLVRLRVAHARGIKPSRTGIRTEEEPIPGEESEDGSQ